MYDFIIIGGGISAMSAALYSSRKKLNTLVLSEEIGGQISRQAEVYNYPGFLDKEGFKLVQNARQQAEDAGALIKESFKVSKIKVENNLIEQNKEEKFFIVESEDGQKEMARALLIASGKKPRKLEVEGEKEFENKGVTYCAICDAPLFSNKIVAVAGGGNAGLDEAMLLTKYAKKIYILEYNDKLKGDEITQEKLKKTGIVTIIASAQILKIEGNKFVESLTYLDKINNKEIKLNLDGVFVSIGLVANSEFCKDVVKLNQNKEIEIDLKTNETSEKGIFASGDVTDIMEKQAIIAAGEGAKAALRVYKYLL